MKVFKKILLGVLAFVVVVIGYFYIGSAPQVEEIIWGVNFSQKQSELLGLDWRETYSALIDDLGVKRVKISTHWDLIEPEKNKYVFEDLDWQIERAEKIILVIGIKTPRWPECHPPEWAESLEKKEQQEHILKMLEKIVLRYRDSETVWAWQVENEPFFPFGKCSWKDKDFLKKEIEVVKSLDPKRPIIISDSGEFSFWITAAKLGDIVATTLHRKVWFQEIKNYITYPLRPVFYWKKSQIIKKFFDKEVIVGELQVEPWCPVASPSECSLAEQNKTMNLNKFRENIEFAKNTGFKEFYLWGAEWMYWLKEKQNQPQIWQEAQKLWE
jgi:hypothetical protein